MILSIRCIRSEGVKSMKYKINIHAHTIFSDGQNSPFTMALKAKELGFTALVITDHFYGHDYPEYMSIHKLDTLKKACKEAVAILPVIIGLEVPFMGQEVLVFGGGAVKAILRNGKPTMDEMLQLKQETGCAVILCHPSEDFELAAPAVDGFEHFNAGNDFFPVGERSFGPIEGKQRWCNSDAHRVADLGSAYNIVDSKITSEPDLIRYIKKGRQPEFVIR